jgi:hypothetical protein
MGDGVNGVGVRFGLKLRLLKGIAWIAPKCIMNGQGSRCEAYKCCIF